MTWDPYNLNFQKHDVVVEDNPFVVKATTASRRACSVNTMSPRMVSAEKVIDNEHSRFTMPAVTFVDPGLCGTIHDVVSLSQRLKSTINTSYHFHDHTEIGNIDVLTMRTFVPK